MFCSAGLKRHLVGGIDKCEPVTLKPNASRVRDDWVADKEFS